MRPYAVGIGLGVWGCADLETMSGSGDHQIMRSGGLEMTGIQTMQIGTKDSQTIGIRYLRTRMP